MAHEIGPQTHGLGKVWWTDGICSLCFFGQGFPVEPKGRTNICMRNLDNSALSGKRGCLIGCSLVTNFALNTGTMAQHVGPLDRFLSLSRPSRRGDETKISSGMSRSRKGVDLILVYTYCHEVLLAIPAVRRTKLAVLVLVTAADCEQQVSLVDAKDCFRESVAMKRVTSRVCPTLARGLFCDTVTLRLPS